MTGSEPRGRATFTERWGAELYGDPCRGCGYDWSLTPADAVRLLGVLPARFARLLDRSTGREWHPNLTWGPVAYVCHVADNLRIWAEGMGAAVRHDGEVTVPGYNPDLLAEARRYHLIDPAGALWSLEAAAALWSGAAHAALDRSVVLHHASRGIQRAADVARNNAHDAVHHVWDIERLLAAGAPRP